MSVLGRKARRDFVRHRWQYLSIAATIFLGVALFAASYDAFLNLESSYRQTYDRLVFADLTITGGDSAELTNRAEAYDDVAAVTTRRQTDIAIRIDKSHSLLGRIVELPESGQPLVNQVDVIAGSWPQIVGAESVLVERHMAEHFDLESGSQVEVRTGASWRSLDVAGAVSSPEYIWPARSRQDLLTSSDDFGVIFAPRSVFDAVADSPVTQTLVRFASGADSPRLVESLTREAHEIGAVGIQTRTDQPSNAALQEDVSGFGELSFLFPMLFLGAAAMATFILLGRVVRSEQAQVATLRANGMATRQIVNHYLGQGMRMATVAGAAGLVVGIGVGRLVTGLYTEAISVPDTVTEFHAITVVAGLLLAVAVGAVASALPAISAGRMQPAMALRGAAPTGVGGRSLLERIVPAVRRLPARWRMVLRGVSRDRRRSFTTSIGVVLALTLILASWGMVDTVDILVERQFNEVQRQDAQLYFDSGRADVVGILERTDGIQRAEKVVQTSMVVGANDARYPTELIAFSTDTQMHDFGTAGLPSGGVVAGRSLGALLDVGLGDTVALAATDGSVAFELPIRGFVDEPLGTFVYTTIANAEALGLSSEATSVMVTFSDGVDRAAMRQTLTALPAVVGYADSRALYDTAQSLLSLFYVFVGVMLAFGGVMAFALIFNTATVNAAERSPELAAMKVNGASSSQLARLLAGENLLLTVLSILPGLAVGYWVSALFMDSFSSDLFDFGLQIRGRTLFLSATAVLAVSAIAQWPASRTVDSLDVARVVRERSQ